MDSILSLFEGYNAFSLSITCLLIGNIFRVLTTVYVSASVLRVVCLINLGLINVYTFISNKQLYLTNKLLLIVKITQMNQCCLALLLSQILAYVY